MAGFQLAQAFVQVVLDDASAQRGFRRLTGGLSRLSDASVLGSAALGGVGLAASAAMGAVGSLGLMFGVGAAAIGDSKDALEEYNKALESGDYSKYQKLMAKMTPAQQEFTKALIETKKPLDDLKKSAANSFLPGLTNALRGAIDLFPVVNAAVIRTGSIMSATGDKFAQLFKSEKFKSDLDGFFKSTDSITSAIGDSFVSLTGRLIQFSKEMAPAAQGFASFITSLTNGVSGMLDGMAPHAESFKRLWVSLGRIVQSLLPIIGELAGWVADHLAPALEGLASFLDQHQDQLVGWAKALLTTLLAIKALKMASVIAGIVRVIPPGLLKALAGGALVVGASQIAAGLAPGDQTTDQTKTDGFVQGTINNTANNLGAAATSLLSDPAGSFEQIKQQLDQVAQKWRDGKTPIQEWYTSLDTSMKSGIDSVTAFGSSTGTAISTWISTTASSVGTFFGNLPSQIGGWLTSAGASISAWFTTTWTGFTTWVSSVGSTVGAFFGGLPGQIGGWLAGAGAAISGWFSSTWSGFTGWVAGVGATVSTFFGSLPGRFSGWLSSTAGVIRSVISGIASNISSWASGVLSTVTSWFSRLPAMASQWFSSMRSSITSKTGEIISFVSGIPGRIMSALGNLGGLLVNAGRSLVNGFLSGLKGAWGAVTGFVSGAIQQVRNLFPFSPAKTGPLSGRGYVTYSGRALTGDFADSLRAGQPGILAAARSLMDATQGPLSGSIGSGPMVGGLPSNGSSTSASGGTVINNYNIINGVTIDGQTVASMQGIEQFFSKVQQTARSY